MLRSARLCTGAFNARLCNAKLATELRLRLPSYTNGQRSGFLQRFEHPAVRRSGVRPTPWISLRRPLEDAPWFVPSWLRRSAPSQHSEQSVDAPESDEAGVGHFYANEYVDLSLFSHFFARPSPVLRGTYVEIGGSNGVHASNTLFFEQHLNWTGVLIEPTPCGRCVLPHTRPRDLTLNAGACLAPTNLTFHSSRTELQSGGSQPVSDRAARHERGEIDMAHAFCPSPQDVCVAHAPGGYQAYAVPCLPMAELLPRSLKHVDLLSVDVEDRALHVLRTMPWERTSVDVVLAECRGSSLQRACERLLRQRGFRILPHDFGGDVLAVRAACLLAPSAPRSSRKLNS